MNRIKFAPLFLLSLVLTSCAGFFPWLYGVKVPKTLDAGKIQRVAIRYGIQPEELFVLDTSYHEFLSTLPSVDSNCIEIQQNKYQCNIRKNHFQPLQILYFDSSGMLVSYHLNCDIPGFPNLKWNYFGNFDVFLPKTTSYCDSLVRFENLIKFLRMSNEQGAIEGNFTMDDYQIVVFWSKFMGRQSKREIRTVRENLDLNLDKKVNVLFVNTDNFSVKYINL